MTVTLVGAGPGDKGLLTIKGAERIRQADVVLYDRFVSDEVLAMIPGGVETIDVGKNAGSHPVPQDEINRLLLEKAKEGLNVVRLKGGDPFIFGRGGEELELLAENGIPFEVVPGVTAAVAGPAYAGIPATHREFASSVHIVTGHARNNEDTNIDFDALVRAGGTLVFMMGVSAIEQLCEGCIAAGMDEDMPAAVVENATTSVQRKFVATVGTLPKVARENHVESPAVIVVGKACSLSERYDWFSKKPLLEKSIIVARAKPGPSRLSEGLRELGCRVTELPGARIVPLTGPGCGLAQALERIESYSWLVFTSSAGVKVFFDYLFKNGTDIRNLRHLKIACVGTETEKEVGKYGINTDYRPDDFCGAALARGLSGLIKGADKDDGFEDKRDGSFCPQRVLIVRAKDGAEDLTRILVDAGIDFDDVAIYEKAWDGTAGADTARTALYAAFTSSSAVERFAEAAGEIDFGGIKAICIGERTAAAARSYGMEVFVSGESTLESMIIKAEEVMK
jgi:uroporphyrinogen III methyltransferase/synthase